MKHPMFLCALSLVCGLSALGLLWWKGSDEFFIELCYFFIFFWALFFAVSVIAFIRPAVERWLTKNAHNSTGHSILHEIGVVSGAREATAKAV